MSDNLQSLIALLATWTNVRGNLLRGHLMPESIQHELTESTMEILSYVIASLADSEGTDKELLLGSVQTAMAAISEAEEQPTH